MKLLKWTAPGRVAFAALLSTTVFAAPRAAQRVSDFCQIAAPVADRFTYVATVADRTRAPLSCPGSGQRRNSGCAGGHSISSEWCAATLSNLSVVCVTDALNGNHLEILKNINVDVLSGRH